MNRSLCNSYFSFRAVILLILLGCYSLSGYSQHTDSATFVNGNWSVRKVAKGIKLHRFAFLNGSLFGSTQNVSYIISRRRFLRNPRFKIAADPKTLIKTSEFARSTDAIAAVNGNFFDMKNGGAVDFTKVNGTVVNTNGKGSSEKLAFHQKAAVVINKGQLHIKKWDGLVNWADWIEEPDVMLNGPLLLFDGVQEKLDSSAFNKNRHPRTAVGVTERGDVIMLVVDGRSSNSAGMSLFELTKIMKWLGCVSAINFDGGGSSTLWVRDRGVVNFPSDNKKWDHEGERRVANALYVK